ncbi:MAG: hypothetical protein GY729_11335, partial [Desulfobacteraceae bacterium]|nr:hypothetical protein [Desulfobacteraceae bacterium]
QYSATDYKIIRKEIDRLQKRIEGQHLEIKKTLLKYASVMEKHREIIFKERLFFLKAQNALTYFESLSVKKFLQIKSHSAPEQLEKWCKGVLMNAIDDSWSQYLFEMGDIKEEIRFYSMGGRNPFLEFQKISVKVFSNLTNKINSQVMERIEQIPATQKDLDCALKKLASPSSTWTYILNDNPLGLPIGIVGDIGLATAAGISGPVKKLLAKFKNTIG